MPVLCGAAAIPLPGFLCAIILAMFPGNGQQIFDISRVA
jgi:hypothetical protein